MKRIALALVLILLLAYVATYLWAREWLPRLIHN
jgi:hypothetical protein